MAVSAPGAPPVLHTAVSANATTAFNTLMATINGKNITKALHIQELATAVGVPASAVPALIAEIAASAPEHIRSALRETSGGRVPAFLLAPSNLKGNE
jgi:hypothetical protein